MESKNMKMWLFRSNLRPLEDYHSINDLETFKKECHDFYILQMLWLLENDYLKTAIVWRLKPLDEKIENKHWSFKNKNFKEVMFSQCWVNDFNEVYHTGLTADISFFRGGFPEYDKLTQSEYSHELGIKLYLGAGQRTYPQYGGCYDKILVEKNIKKKNTMPFYKTASSNIFYNKPSMGNSLYDICYISNFTQLRYKGQEEFIKKISESEYLKKLKIIHIGNKPEVGTKLCHKYNVYNIQFMGWLSKHNVNNILNQSKFGLVYSNKLDGTPRVITEILQSGTPLLVSSETKLLDYYKSLGTISFANRDFEKVVKIGMDNYKSFKEQVKKINHRYTIETICKLNWKNWTKK